MNPAEQTWATVADELRRYVRRRVADADADDVVQDVLLRVVDAQASLDPNRPIAPWVQTVARNALIDRARKRTPAPPPEAGDVDPERMTIEAQAEAQRALLGAWLELAVDRLPEPYRDAVRRVDVRGESQAHVAQALGLPRSTVKSRVQRGRAKLRDIFFACCEAEFDVRGRLDTVRARDNSSCCDS